MEPPFTKILFKKALYSFGKDYDHDTYFKDPKTDAEVYSSKQCDPSYKRVLYFYFPGSNSEQDWEHNLNFIRKDAPVIGRVHGGIWEQFLSLLDHIQERITKVDPDQIVISGYSLGGGIAQLFARHHSYRSMIPLECFTFGAPKVFVEPLNLPSHVKSISFMLRDDLITYGVPHFYSLGTRIIVSKNGIYCRDREMIHFLWPRASVWRKKLEFRWHRSSLFSKSIKWCKGSWGHEWSMYTDAMDSFVMTIYSDIYTR